MFAGKRKQERVYFLLVVKVWLEGCQDSDFLIYGQLIRPNCSNDSVVILWILNCRINKADNLYQATFSLNVFIDWMIELFSTSSCSISKSSCNPIQNLWEFPKYLLSLKAVSAVILRFPLIIWDNLVWGILISIATCIRHR